MKKHLLPFCPGFLPVAILVAFVLVSVSKARAQTFPDAPDAETGNVTVTLDPPGIASGWHFVGEQIWRASGEQATGLVLGEREIEFRPLPGYVQPYRQNVVLSPGNANVSLAADYFKAFGSPTSILTVNLKPDDVAAQSVPQPARAQWRLLGEGDSEWSDSGVSRQLLPGVYLVESKPVAGKTTPPPVSVTVSENASSNVSVTYFAKDAATGAQPTVIDFATINATNLPYAHVGQIRSNNSTGTGCVVLSNTVATAAHLVFDEENLTYFAGLQWLFQRDSGTHEPVPRIPQRVGILTSYASQRVLDGSPGQLSARSRSCDVAALYFATPPGRNGSAGYVLSDPSFNDPLTSARLKTIACYPMDGIAVANQGKMHATAPSNVTFTRNPDFSDSTPNDTYFTTDITSVGGAAGAPVFVADGSGGYDCAAIYVGGSDPNEVRSFTKDVDVLFFWAQTNGDAPSGGITTVNGATTSNSSSAGAIRINLTPSNGYWKIEGDEKLKVSGSYGPLRANTYRISFTDIAGYKTPPPITVVVSPGEVTEVPIDYVPIGPITKIIRPGKNSTVSKKGFFVRGTASDPNGIRQFQVKISGKPAAMVLPGKLYFSGRFRRNSLTIQMRAQNKAGVWGPFTSITVRAR